MYVRRRGTRQTLRVQGLENTRPDKWRLTGIGAPPSVPAGAMSHSYRYRFLEGQDRAPD